MSQQPTLAQLVRRGGITVFKGVQNGGKLYPIKSFLIPDGLSTQPESMFLEVYVAKFFLTLTPAPNDPNFFTYFLDEKSSKSGRWYRQLGVAHILTEESMVINETDGMYGSLVNDKGNIILYRERSGETPTVMHADNLKISSIQARDKKIFAGCTPRY